jgi:hypothetical protein
MNLEIGYNLTSGGHQNSIVSEHSIVKLKGRKLSSDTKEKIRLANLGKLQSKETREKRSRALKGRLGPMKGRVHSEEVKKKISLSNKGRKRDAPSELTKKKISETLKNKKI